MGEAGIPMAGLASGLAQGYAQGLEKKRDRQQQAINTEYMKSQKRLVDAQWKAAEATRQWWESQPQNMRWLQHMPKEIQTAYFLLNRMQPPPQTAQLPGQSPTQPDIADQIFAGQPAAAQPQPTTGIGDQMSQILYGGLMNKTMGINPLETTNLRNIAGPGGQPVTQVRNRWTGELMQVYPEAQQWQEETRQLPSGAVVPYYRPKYGPPPGAGGGVTVGGRPAIGGGQQTLPAPAAPSAPGGAIVKQPEITTITFRDAEGRKFEQDINAVNRQPVGEPRLLEQKKGLPAESAGKLSMLWGGKQDLEDFIDLVSIKDKEGNIVDWNKKILFSMAPSVPYLGGIGPIPGSKGEEAYSLLYNAMEAKIRTESGAAVPEPEVERMAKRFAARWWQRDATIESRLRRLGRFLTGAAKAIDPEDIHKYDPEMVFRGVDSETGEPKTFVWVPGEMGEREQKGSRPSLRLGQQQGKPATADEFLQKMGVR
jgi:hypothetical protein